MHYRPSNLFQRFAKRKNKILRPRIVQWNGLRFWTDQTVPWTVRKAIYNYWHESEERQLVEAYVEPTDKVLEFGGCMGIITCVTASLVKNGPKVVVFEPNPVACNILRRNLKLNNLDATVIEKGVGMESGSVRFSVSEKDPIATSSERNLKDGSDSSFEVVGINEAIREYAPSVIIMDIEGAEVHVLKNAELSKTRVIVLEVHPDIVGDGLTQGMHQSLIDRGFVLEEGTSVRVYINQKLM